MKLSQLQEWMRWIIVDPRGVHAALKNPYPARSSHPDRYVSPKNSAYHLIHKSGKIHAKERLAVYAEGYFARIAEALEIDFSVAHKVLGNDSFLKLMSDYLKEHPSHTQTMADIGCFLPRFVKTHSFQNDIPYLYDLISLEWRMIESFYANNLPDLDVQALFSLSEEEWENAKMTLDPSLQFLQCEWPVDELWHHRACEDFAAVEKSLQSKFVALSVYRSFEGVTVENIALPEMNVLKLLQKGHTLGQVIQEIETDESQNLMDWFAKWTNRGWIKHVQFN